MMDAQLKRSNRFWKLTAVAAVGMTVVAFASVAQARHRQPVLERTVPIDCRAPFLPLPSAPFLPLSPQSLIHTFIGTASSIAGEAFTLTDERGTSFTVVVSPRTTIINGMGHPLTLKDMRTGDAVSIRGSLAAGTISAISVVDISQ